MKRHFDNGTIELSAADLAKRPATVASQLRVGDLVYVPPDEMRLNRGEDDRREDDLGAHKPCVRPSRVKPDIEPLRAALRARGRDLHDERCFYWRVTAATATSRVARHA